MLGAVNTCGAGQIEVQSKEECDQAVKQISEFTGVLIDPEIWHGEASWVPPKCSIQMKGDKYMRVFNFISGNNNGHYRKVCKLE